jgi:putative ABC transport system permease protein
MRTPIVEGREYEARDLEPRAPAVVIVNDVLARRYWPGRGAVGRHMTDRSGARFQVVGVARRAPQLSLGQEPRPQAFLPNRPTEARAMTVVVRGSGDPASLLEDVRASVSVLDERIPLYNMKTAARHVEVALAPARWGALALNGIGLVALLLAAVGLHATLAFFVARRTHEIGIRRALGADHADIVWLVARRLLAPVGMGLAGGTALGLAASGALASLLYGVRTTDPAAFALAPLALLLASLIAAWLPARRAVRLDPARALRCE